VGLPEQTVGVLTAREIATQQVETSDSLKRPPPGRVLVFLIAK